MNIPYADFYAAEVTDASGLDAVASATLMKPQAGSLAGGSYHTDPAGSDISGVIFPVYVEDAAVLPALGGIEITDDSSEEREIPAAEFAFTGTFDGQGYTIRNLTVNQPDGWSLGLFGVISGTEIGNFTLENAVVDGSMMASDVVGYAYCSTVSNVNLVNGRVNAHYTEIGAEGMYGGIVGAGMSSRIEGCSAQAEIVIPDGTANAGIIGGGLELTSVVNCAASGTVTAGNHCYGLGGISGCGFGAEEFTGDTAENMTITAGADAEGVGDIVGSGFYNAQAAEMRGEPFDKPTVFVITDCKTE